MRISDWSSDVCSSDLGVAAGVGPVRHMVEMRDQVGARPVEDILEQGRREIRSGSRSGEQQRGAAPGAVPEQCGQQQGQKPAGRSEEHTSELQSLMSISYAVFCLKKKTTQRADKQRS